MSLKPVLIAPDVYSLSQSPWVSVTGPTPERVWEDIGESLRYDKDWNYLMEVVREIGFREKTLKHLMGIVTMHSLNRTTIQCYFNERLIETIDESDIAGMKATYEAVVKYIKWWNKIS